MRLLAAAFLLAIRGASAQEPEAVPLPKEPHHHLVLENEYVRVFRVSVPGRGETLLHQHDVPYIYLSLGPADVTNAVQGKPEAKLVLADGQIGYSRGNFAHVARVNGDADFNNVTIELLKKQGEPRNLCEKVIDGPLNCKEALGGSERPRPVPIAGAAKRLLETDEVVASTGLAGTVVIHAATSELLVAGDGAELWVTITGGSEKTLKGGEVMWLPARGSWEMKNMLKDRASRYLLLSFKD